MTKAEYEELVKSVNRGEILVGIDTLYARKVVTCMRISDIQKDMGESPYTEKYTVLSALILSPLAILLSIILAIPAFDWWAFLVVPVALLWWIVNKIFSVSGSSGGFGLHTLLLIASIASIFLNVISNMWIAGYLIAFFSALWCDRYVYYAATIFLRAFILRNQTAFEVFTSGITLREVSK